MNPYKYYPEKEIQEFSDWTIDKEPPRRYNRIVDWSDLFFVVFVLFFSGILGVLLFMRA